MYATVRRYEGIDESRSDEMARRIGESLMPRLSELPGFGGYYLIEASEGVLTSVGLFSTAEQAHESTRVAARWIREHRCDRPQEHVIGHRTSPCTEPANPVTTTEYWPISAGCALVIT